MVEGKTLITVFLAVILLGIGIAALARPGAVTETPLAFSFEECAERGYEVLEEVPRRCVTPEGISFTEGGAAEPEPEVIAVPPSASTTTPPEEEGPVSSCVIAGCSSQLCVEEGDPGMSTCEYRSEYACYQGAVCERQASGQCGWTETPELIACLEDPPEL